MFRTWLVSLNADSSFHSWHGGFSWDWTNAGGKSVASNVKMLKATPTKAEYNDLIGGFADRVPEPETYLLLITGLMVFGCMRARLRR
ncbi:MAG: PEP-CTERM sorting domain-containing protein [Acidimicrobiia bacterium]|nr:PEP-CTERM sorting domain-containing protein [Acidimicrobiia bacterium]